MSRSRSKALSTNAACAAEHPDAGPGRRGHGAGAEVADRPGLVPARQERVVLGHRGAAEDLGVDALHRSEQVDRGVDDVGLQVEHDPAALGGRGGLAPALLGHGPPAFPTHLGPEHLAEPTRADHVAHGDVLGVVPAVLEHGQRHARVPRGVQDGERVTGVRGQRLVDDHRQPGIDHLPRLVGVQPARGREHDDVEAVEPAATRRGRGRPRRPGTPPGPARPARGSPWRWPPAAGPRPGSAGRGCPARRRRNLRDRP